MAFHGLTEVDDLFMKILSSAFLGLQLGWVNLRGSFDDTFSMSKVTFPFILAYKMIFGLGRN